ncbi:MAG: class III extradiol dioxygenase subunit B-like domain-containing protein [Patescibacteria group bacterium]
MPLSVAALLPHSPLLIPEIGQANYKFLAKSAAAYERIAAKLQAAEIETIIVLSPHAGGSHDSFLLNVAPEMAVDLKDFGFIPSKTAWPGDARLADQITAALRPDFSVQLVSESVLDNGSAVPLYLLRQSLPQAKALVISPGEALDLPDQLAFGQKLQTALAESGKRLAVIASGDLSHRLKKKSPGGYSPKGAKFDNKLIEYLSEPATAADNILKMDPKFVSEALECGLKPLLILLGILPAAAWQPAILAYQTDFGVGYLSVDFQLPS